MGSYFLLQGIFPTQGLNPGILYCRQYFYWLRHQGSPITKFHRLINNRNLFLTGLDPGSHRSECQCGHVMMRAVFCADFSRILTRQTAEQRRKLSHDSHKGTNSMHKGSILMISPIFNFLPKSPPPHTITLENRVSTYKFTYTNIQSITMHVRRRKFYKQIKL